MPIIITLQQWHTVSFAWLRHPGVQIPETSSRTRCCTSVPCTSPIGFPGPIVRAHSFMVPLLLLVGTPVPCPTRHCPRDTRWNGFGSCSHPFLAILAHPGHTCTHRDQVVCSVLWVDPVHSPSSFSPRIVWQGDGRLDTPHPQLPAL